MHNCIECNDNYLFRFQINNSFNCYKNCSYYYYFDNETNSHCTNNLSCPDEYPKLEGNKKECIKLNNINNIIGTTVNLVYNEITENIETTVNLLYNEITENIYTTLNLLDNEIAENMYTTINLLNNEIIQTEKLYEGEVDYDNILQNNEKEFTSDNYDTSNLDNGQDEIMITCKITTTLTTSENQRNNKNYNMSRIDLGECENLIRKFYNLSNNESLYIKKIDIQQKEMKTIKVEYDVYAKLFGKNLIKLNLTICQKSKISILIPFEITDNLDKYNTSSGYYNDICYSTTSENGTDILLIDRQKEYIDKNKIVCQENCDFSEYNYDTLVAKCSCEVKESSESFADLNINKEKILENFIKIKNIINFNFLKCYDKLFNQIGILNNIGSYIIFVIILLHIISILVFILYHFSLIKKKIKKIISFKENEKNKQYTLSKNNRLNTKKKSLNKNYSKKLFKKLKTSNKKALNFSKTKINSKKEKFKNKTEIIKNYIDEEINDFSYNLAIKKDKRNYCQYYISLLKTQHNLICAFCNNNDYNSGIIKIDLFLIGFSIEYTVNALFYNDDTMHKIYESKGNFDFEEQLPIAIYSTIISMILNYPLNFLAFTNDAIINFKQSNTKINLLKKSKRLIKVLFFKFILYFVISFLLLLFFWYYISMFCVIYRNTQIHLLKDTLMSFGLSLIIPFIIYFFPGVFRISALANPNKKRKCLYNFSKFLQSL